MLTPAAFLAIIQTGGAIAVLVVAVVGFQQRWWVTAGEYAEKLKQIAELERDRDLYRDLVYRNSGSQQTQAQAVQQLTEQLLAALGQAKASP